MTSSGATLDPDTSPPSTAPETSNETWYTSGDLLDAMEFPIPPVPHRNPIVFLSSDELYAYPTNYDISLKLVRDPLYTRVDEIEIPLFGSADTFKVRITKYNSRALFLFRSFFSLFPKVVSRLTAGVTTPTSFPDAEEETKTNSGKFVSGLTLDEIRRVRDWRSRVLDSTQPGQPRVRFLRRKRENEIVTSFPNFDLAGDGISESDESEVFQDGEVIGIVVVEGIESETETESGDDDGDGEGEGEAEVEAEVGEMMRMEDEGSGDVTVIETAEDGNGEIRIGIEEDDDEFLASLDFSGSEEQGVRIDDLSRKEGLPTTTDVSPTTTVIPVSLPSSSSEGKEETQDMIHLSPVAVVSPSPSDSSVSSPQVLDVGASDRRVVRNVFANPESSSGVWTPQAGSSWGAPRRQRPKPKPKRRHHRKSAAERAAAERKRAKRKKLARKKALRKEIFDALQEIKARQRRVVEPHPPASSSSPSSSSPSSSSSPQKAVLRLKSGRRVRIDLSKVDDGVKIRGMAKKKRNVPSSLKKQILRERERVSVSRLQPLGPEDLCNRVTPEFNDTVFAFLQNLSRLQDAERKRFDEFGPSRRRKKRKKRPRVFEKRFVFGLKETLSRIRLHRLRRVEIILCASDLEKVTGKRGILGKVEAIREFANERSVPFGFALTRQRLGEAIGKPLEVAMVCVMNIRETKREFDAVRLLLESLMKTEEEHQREKEAALLLQEAIDEGALNSFEDENENEDEGEGDEVDLEADADLGSTQDSPDADLDSTQDSLDADLDSTQDSLDADLDSTQDPQ